MVTLKCHTKVTEFAIETSNTWVTLWYNPTLECHEKLLPVPTMPKVFQCHQRNWRRSVTCLNPITAAQCYQTPLHILLLLITKSLKNEFNQKSDCGIQCVSTAVQKKSNFFTFSIRPLHKNIFDKIKKYFLLVYFIAKSISLSLLYQINILYHSASRIKY